MHLVQILLPLYDNQGQALAATLHADAKTMLTEKFGGLTAYVRSPAEGRWKDSGNERRDDIVIYEVMTTELDEEWWRSYRATLEADFRQEEVIVRALPIRLL